jgi:hypothetical protein
MDPPETLGLQLIENATLLPVARAHPPLLAARSGGLGFLLGAHGAGKGWVRALAHERHGETATPPTSREAEEEWSGEYVYGGILWSHFGHFLIEGLSRAWGLPSRPGLPVVWHRTGGAGPRVPQTPWQRDILDVLGHGGREHRVVERPVRIAKLWVPDQGFVLRRYFHPCHAAALGVHPFAPPVPGRRIWLSRSALPRGLPGIDGERALEALLVEAGWTILHPETCGVRDQLRVIEDAEAIAGFEGSAFHLLMLGRGIGARVAIVERGRKLLQAYSMIGRVKRLDQFGVRVATRPVLGQGNRPSSRLEDPSEVMASLHKVLSAPREAVS